MISSLLVLAVLMAGVTYPSRAVPLLTPGIERLPPRVLTYLQLVGPAVLASLAAVNVLIASSPSGGYDLKFGPEVLGVLVCVGLVAWRRNLFLGLFAAAFIVAAARLTTGV